MTNLYILIAAMTTLMGPVPHSKRECRKATDALVAVLAKDTKMYVGDGPAPYLDPDSGIAAIQQFQTKCRRGR